MSDTFTCLAFDDNASAVSFLYSKGGTITFVGSLRNTPDNTAVLIVEELHFQNKFAVKVDVNFGANFLIVQVVCSQANENGSLRLSDTASVLISINTKRGFQSDSESLVLYDKKNAQCIYINLV